MIWRVYFRDGGKCLQEIKIKSDLDNNEDFEMWFGVKYPKLKLISAARI